MAEVVGKTYLPTLTRELQKICDYTTKHSGVLLAVVAILSPADLAAFTVGISNVQAFCTLVNKVERIYDPNYGDHVAGAG